MPLERLFASNSGGYLSMSNFKEINDAAIVYVKNIQNDIKPEESYNLLVAAFQPIINKIVKSVKHNGNIDRDDLVQEAEITLWKCCSKYDFNSTASFYTYFYNCCWNALNAHAYKFQTAITMNKHEKERTKVMREFAKSYYDLHGRYPTLEEYVDCGFSERLARRYIDYINNMNGACVVVDENNADSGSIELDYENKEMIEALMGAVNALEERYQQIIKMRYFEKMTYKQISEKMNIGSTTVQTHEKKAIEILKARLVSFA